METLYTMMQSGAIQGNRDLLQNKQHPEYSLKAAQQRLQLSTSVVMPTNSDVLMGRGGKNNQHIGNERLRLMACDCIEMYREASKKDKPLIASLLVVKVKSLQPAGRFLKLNSKTTVWEEVTDEVACEKACQCLRDAVLSVTKSLKVKEQVAQAVALGKIRNQLDNSSDKAQKNQFALSIMQQHPPLPTVTLEPRPVGNLGGCSVAISPGSSVTSLAATGAELLQLQEQNRRRTAVDELYASAAAKRLRVETDLEIALRRFGGAGIAARRNSNVLLQQRLNQQQQLLQANFDLRNALTWQQQASLLLLGQSNRTSLTGIRNCLADAATTPQAGALQGIDPFAWGAGLGLTPDDINPLANVSPDRFFD